LYSINEIRKVKANAEPELFKKGSVKALGIGFKVVGNQETDEPVIRVYVDTKSDKVSDNDMIPKTIGGIKTDVIELKGTAVAHSQGQPDRTAYSDIQGGYNCGQIKLYEENGVRGINNGTIGAIFTDNRLPTKRLIGSSYHVLAVDNSHRIGDANSLGDPISQPSGAPDRIIAHLDRAFLSRTIDAAAAVITDTTKTVSPRILGIDDVTGSASDEEVEAIWRERRTVRKSGVTTGTTNGTIVDLAKTMTIRYPFVGDWMMFDQLAISPNGSIIFSDGGDSGSCIVDDSAKVVGLLLGGVGSISLANRISEVESQLRISVLHN
jgi:hypothetical protein